MNLQTVGAVIMLGGGGDSPQEQLVVQAQRAAALDLVETLQAEAITPVVLAAPDLDWLPLGLDVFGEKDAPDEPFHFGRRLAALIDQYHLSPVMYFGGGSAPLVDRSMVNVIAGMLCRAGAGGPNGIPSHIALTNNLHSSDWVALTDLADGLPIVERADRDNSLAWLLHNSGEFEVRVIAGMRPATSLDLDTPSDLALMAHHPDCKPRLAEIVKDDRLRAVPVREVAEIAATPESHLTLIGRVSPAAWQALNRATQCWVRVYAEERGMVASGRIERGDVQSLLGVMIRQQGARAFFQALAEMCDAAIIDSRPIMASQGVWPSDADRFASDLFLVDAIQDPWLREFTAAAAEAPIPVILGGHSVVAGGLYALIELIERGSRRR